MKLQCYCRRPHATGGACPEPATWIFLGRHERLALCDRCADTTSTYPDELIVPLAGISRVRQSTRISTDDLDMIRLWVNAHADVDNFKLTVHRRHWEKNSRAMWAVVISGDSMPAGLAASDRTIAGALNKIAQLVAGVNTEVLCREEK